jgi:arabinogalactan endo-1,4-beta-galactosidase
LRSSGWEIAQKLKLSTKEDVVYPYATLSLETLRPEDVGIFAWFLPEIGHSEYLTFDCDEGDLDDLMQLLQDAKSALKEARKGA